MYMEMTFRDDGGNNGNDIWAKNKQLVIYSFESIAKDLSCLVVSCLV
jgi:hypothetical protein